MTTKTEIFLKTYEECLRHEVAQTPQNYSYGPDKIPVVIERATKAFNENGIISFALGGQAIRIAFKRLGIPKMTYKAFNEWLNEA